ncbi:hypothetical protein ACFSSA_12290 [Luteolibacter algae]|uniref:Uncharacterized protein n=1 Tax=Luteolibacter algae TaxID=454151 RepID=A0ABW5DAA3_9BACT
MISDFRPLLSLIRVVSTPSSHEAHNDHIRTELLRGVRQLADLMHDEIDPQGDPGLDYSKSNLHYIREIADDGLKGVRDHQYAFAEILDAIMRVIHVPGGYDEP